MVGASGNTNACMEDVPDFDQFDLSSEQSNLDSAPLRAEVKARTWLATVSPVSCLNHYGLTERGGVTVLNSAEHRDKLQYGWGQTLAPGNEIRLIDVGRQRGPQGARWARFAAVVQR